MAAKASKPDMPPLAADTTALDEAIGDAQKAIDGLAASDVTPAGRARVRLSIRPDELTEVDEAELPVLRMQGLLIEDSRKDAS